MPATLRDFKAALFRALANPLRIHILEELRVFGSLTVGELQQRVGIEASNLSQHLAILRAHSLVNAQREGTNVRYSAADAAVFTILDGARTLFQDQLARQRELLSGSSSQ